MRHALFPGDQQILIGEREAPAPGPGELRLDVLACSLCGSELRVWRGGWPVTPGHEVVGRINAPGHAEDGRRALVYIPVWCGVCDLCKAGQTHLCTAIGELIGWQRHGGYADSLIVPERCLLPLPDDVPTELAPLLLDCIGTPAHGIRLARRLVSAGPVAVIGAGPVGLGGVLAAPALGFPEVWVAEPRAHRRQMAIEFGARDLADETRPRFPLVLESSGVDAARQRAIELTAPGGVCVFLGESDRWSIAETRAIRRKDFHIIRSFYFPIGDFQPNLGLLRANRERYRRFVDGRVPLDGLADLFRSFAAGERIKPQFAVDA